MGIGLNIALPENARTKRTMDSSNSGTSPSRWLTTRVVGSNKPQSKFFLACGIYSVVAIIVIMVFLTAFTSGVVFGVPHDFAVDNEGRVYLSYTSGVYMFDQGKRYAIWPPVEEGVALSISEDDQLTFAEPAQVRVVDLTKSDLKSGRLEVVKSYDAPANVLNSIGLEQHQTDRQNGVTYRYKSSFFYYEIFREDSSGSRLFFAMPHSDYVWSLAAKACFALFFLYVGLGLLAVYLFTKKHPDVWGKYTRTSLFKVRKQD